MDEEHRCPQCGAVLPADGPKDFCPNCVIGVVAEDVPAPDSPAPTAQPGHRQWRRPVWLVVAAAFVVAFLLLFWIWMPAQLPRPPERFVVATSTEGDLRTGGIHPEVAISPDGTRIAYVGGGTPQTRQLYLRQLGQLDASPMPGTDGGTSPVFSPDGEWVAFLQGDSTLRRVSMLGSRAQTVLETESPVRVLSWGPDDMIVFGTPNGLWRISAWGGEPQSLTTVSTEREAHLWPDVLPDLNGVLYTVWSGSVEASRLAVVSLKTGEIRDLLPGGSHPRYSPTGHIVYGVEGALWAVGFDLGTHTLTSRAPVPVLDHVNTKDPSGAASFGLSHDGSLVYVSGTATQTSPPARLAWMDREGREQPLELPARGYAWPRVSPDGRHVAVTIVEPDNTDLWVVDVGRETLTRLTFDEADDLHPVWTPDGRQLVFASRRAESTQMSTTAADGTGTVEPLIEGTDEAFPASFSPDGRQLVVEERSRDRGHGLALLEMERTEALEPLLDTEFAERNPEISPDGRWIAYESDESGRFEVYIRPFPAVDEGKWIISRAGGTRPLWAPDGRELFFVEPGERLMAVPIHTTDTTVSLGRPEALANLPPDPARLGRNYDVSPDGRFIVVRQAGVTDDPSSAHRVVIVQHWLPELLRLVPTH